MNTVTSNAQGTQLDYYVGYNTKIGTMNTVTGRQPFNSGVKPPL